MAITVARVPLDGSDFCCSTPVLQTLTVPIEMQQRGVTQRAWSEIVNSINNALNDASEKANGEATTYIVGSIILCIALTVILAYAIGAAAFLVVLPGASMFMRIRRIKSVHIQRALNNVASLRSYGLGAAYKAECCCGASLHFLAAPQLAPNPITTAIPKQHDPNSERAPLAGVV